MKKQALVWLAAACLIALIFLNLGWELRWAPLRPGGSFLAAKALLLLLPLRGILQGRRYTYQWASMFILIFFTEGVVRAWSDTGLSQKLAVVELALSVVFFAASVAYAWLSAPSRNRP